MRLNYKLKDMFASSASTRTGNSYIYTYGRIEDAGSMEMSLISVSPLYSLK